MGSYIWTKSFRPNTLPIPNVRVAFITAIYGNYEATCKKYALQTIPVDFICFTDNSNIVSNGWIIDTTPYHITHPSPIDIGLHPNSLKHNKHTFNIAKYYKQAFQNIPRLDQYEVVIWLDGTIEIIDSTCAAWILSNIKEHKIITWNYSGKGKRTLKAEVDGSNIPRYTSTFWNNQWQPYQDIPNQYEAYIRDGYDENKLSIGIWITCFIAFDNKSSNVTDFLNKWYLQTLVYTTQDQVSFPYVSQILDLVPYTLPNENIHGDDPCVTTQFYIKHLHGK